MVDKVKRINISWSTVFVTVVTTLVCFLVLSLILFHFWNPVLIDISNCPAGIEKKHCLISGNWDSSTYLSILTGFYNTIITVLIAAIGVLGTLAFILVKGAARQQAEEEVEKEVGKYFDTEIGQEKIQKAIYRHDREGIRNLETTVQDIMSVLEENDIFVPSRLDHGEENA